MTTDSYEVDAHFLHQILLKAFGTRYEADTLIRNVTMMLNGYMDASMEYVSVLLEILNYEGLIHLKREDKGKIKIKVRRGRPAY